MGLRVPEITEDTFLSSNIDAVWNRYLRGNTVNPATQVLERPQPVATPRTSAYSPNYALENSYTARTAQGVYDLSYYGHDLRFQLEKPGLTAQSITYSTATFGRSHDDDFTPNASGSVAYRPLILDPARILSNVDQGFILHEGNDTAFNMDYILHADMTAAIHQIRLSMAFGLNVSAYSAGNFAINSVTFTLNTYQNAQQPTQGNVGTPVVIEPETAFSALTATGTQIFIIQHDLDVPRLLWQDQPLTLNITVNETTGTGTRQVGLVPLWPMFAASGNKMYYESEMQAHIHPLPQHINDLIPMLGDFTITSFTNGKPAGVF